MTDTQHSTVWIPCCWKERELAQEESRTSIYKGIKKYLGGVVKYVNTLIRIAELVGGFFPDTICIFLLIPFLRHVLHFNRFLFPLFTDHGIKHCFIILKSSIHFDWNIGLYHEVHRTEKTYSLCLHFFIVLCYNMQNIFAENLLLTPLFSIIWLLSQIVYALCHQKV